MEKIGHPDAASLLSQQVSRARYFFLNLAPRPAEPLTLVMGGREHCNPDYVVSRRNYPFFVLEYVVSGHGTVTLDGQAHTLGPGVVFASAPKTRCEIRTDPQDTMEKYFLAFAGRAVQKIAGQGEFGKDYQVGLGGYSLLDLLFDERQVVGHATELWFNLGQDGRKIHSISLNCSQSSLLQTLERTVGSELPT